MTLRERLQTSATNTKPWTSPEDRSIMEQTSGFARAETVISHSSPHTQRNLAHFLPPVVHIFPKQPPQYLDFQQKTPLSTEARMSLFHWQIQAEAQRIEEISPELLNMHDSDGDTYLHIAVAHGRRALAYVLAAKMAGYGTLNKKERNGQTALQIATVTNQPLIAHDLIAHGASINTGDSWGRSPLHVCAEKGHCLTLQTIWRTALQTGQVIDVDMFNYEGLTPLHTAILSHNAVIKEIRSLENPCLYMAQKLVQKKHMYLDCIKTLLHMGASLTTTDLKSGRTCLYMASERANVELLKEFLDQPLSVSIINNKTFSGNTALHVVCSLQNCKGQVEALKLLMRHGADPGIRNLENDLPLHLVPEGSIGGKLGQILKGKLLKLK
ncbi:NF-kappa-B inhibitor zeta isoform X2 [Cynoglossus semilaevis]|uniref:NF-kappa-B inhibitor zeta-like n=1 Tax=Cynoglossus semilaevis TaxID=244447 RepID=A0A3P8VEJ2_CYNSE|nr:NF-kappa-B inhibitor zeta-like isoform X2 [Cynoglossus semilaevis]